MDIAKCLKHLRVERGWTQADLHRASGYERAYISKLESGRVKTIGVRTAIRICRAFGISVEEFAALCDELDETEGIERRVDLVDRKKVDLPEAKGQ